MVENDDIYAEFFSDDFSDKPEIDESKRIREIKVYEKFIRENFEKVLKLAQYAMSHHERLCKGILEDAKTLENNKNEQIKRLENEVETLKNEVKKINQSIILSKVNANRNGRPALDEETIIAIRKHLADGHTHRQTAEYLGVSKGAVSKYSKADNDLTESEMFKDFKKKEV